MAFNEDIKAFVDFLKTNSDSSEARKEYRKLLKKYHPDIAEEKDKSLFNKYILLINKVYSAGKIVTKEFTPETQNEQDRQKTYVFTKTGPDGKTYSYKCRDYYDYLFKVARSEYDKGHEILHSHDINYLDKKAIDQNSLEVMQHYYNAIKCCKFILKNCSDNVILNSVEFDLTMVQDSVNKLAQTIITSDEKSLATV